MVEPLLALAPPPPPDIVFSVGLDDLCLSGVVATDGSSLEGSTGPCAIAGWSAVTGKQCGIYGPLPFVDQSILAAEIWGARMFVKYSVGGERLIVDNGTLHNGLFAGRAWGVWGLRPLCHLWRALWDALDEAELVPSEGVGLGCLAITKGKATALPLKKRLLD